MSVLFDLQNAIERLYDQPSDMQPFLNLKPLDNPRAFHKDRIRVHTPHPDIRALQIFFNEFADKSEAGKQAMLSDDENLKLLTDAEKIIALAGMAMQTQHRVVASSSIASDEVWRPEARMGPYEIMEVERNFIRFCEHMTPIEELARVLRNENLLTPGRTPQSDSLLTARFASEPEAPRQR